MKNKKIPYLAEGEAPADVPVIYVGVSAGAAPPCPRRYSSCRRRRFFCAGRFGSKIEDTPNGAVLVESAT